MAGILDGLTHAQQIEAIYVAYYGRAADGGGYLYWEGAAQTMSPVAIANSFAVQNESKSMYGLLANPIPTASLSQTDPIQIAAVDAFLTQVYQNLFNRVAVSSDLSYWQTQILSGAVTIGSAVYTIANGAATGSADATAVLDKIDAATFFTIQTYAANEGTTSPLTASFAAAAKAAVASVVDATTDAASHTASTAYANQLPPGQVFTLTTGIDQGAAFVGTTGADIYNAPTATFTSLDQLNGVAGADVLNIASTGAFVTPVGATVINIPTINVAATGSVTFDTTPYTGTTALNVNSVSAAGAVDTITAAATTAIKVTDVTSAAVTGNMTVNGGSTVTISEVNGAFDSHAKTITVLGGTGTTAVSVTQTETASTMDQAVTITDVNEGAGTKAGIITSVTLDGLDAQATAINDSALANLSISNQVATDVVTITEGAWTSPATTLNLTLNNDKALTVNDASSKYTTLAITTGATKSALTEGAGFTAVTAETIAGSSVLTQTAAAMAGLVTVAISGAAGLTDSDLNTLGATLTSVTSTSSGVITVSLNDTTTAFTGGTGQDIVTITAVATKAIAGGTATNNEIVWNGTGSNPTTFGLVTGFTTLGAGPLTNGVTFDLSVLTGFNSIDVQANATGGTDIFKKVAVTSGVATPLAIDGSVTGGVTYQTSDSSGATDSLAVTIGGTAANTTAFTVNALTTTDSSTTTGIGTLNFTSFNATVGAGNTITTLTDANLSALNISGNGALAIGTLADTVGTLTITNTSTSTLASVITGLTDNALSTLNFAGTDATTITTLTDGGTGIAINNSDTGAVLISTATVASMVTISATDAAGSGAFSIPVLTDSAAVIENFTNNGSSAMTIAAVGTALVTLTLAGSVAYSASADAITTGLTVTGGTDNAIVSITMSGSNTGVTSITLGNGADTFSDAAATAASTVGVNMGTGADIITVGAGTNTITLGAHSVSVADTINLALETSGSEHTTTVNGFQFGVGADVLTLKVAGFATADHLLSATAVGGTLAASVGSDTTVLQTYVTGTSQTATAAFGSTANKFVILNDTAGAQFGTTAGDAAAAVQVEIRAHGITAITGATPTGEFLFAYKAVDGIHIAGVEYTTAATDTSAVTVKDIVDLVGVTGTLNIHDIHLIA